MWRKSDERRVRKLFRTVQPEPVPDTLRKGLQVDIEGRFAEPTLPRIGLFSRALRPKPLLVGAGIVIVAVLAGALLTLPRSPDLFAAVLEAMAEVKTMHITSIGDIDGEEWFSRDHGLRREYGGYVAVFTPEATWTYRARENKVVISEPQPDTVAQALRMLSYVELLEELNRDSTATKYRVSDAVLDGAAVKRIDFELDEAERKGTIWIDADTMRTVLVELWRVADGQRTLETRGRCEYDVHVDPALFIFQSPAGATIVDCRIDSELREVIAHAIEALKTLPIHETGGWFPFPCDKERDFDRWESWEAWREYAIGYRQEYSYGVVHGGNIREEWYLGQSIDAFRRDARVEDQYMSHFGGRAYYCLLALQRGESGRVGRYPLEDAPEVIREEDNGRTLARFVGFFVTPSDTNAVSERCKEVTTLDVDAQRLVEYELYVWSNNQWRLAQRLQCDYLDELPPGIFDFDPPPGGIIEDLRKR